MAVSWRENQLTDLQFRFNCDINQECVKLPEMGVMEYRIKGA